jgi:hypothetical protein
MSVLYLTAIKSYGQKTGGHRKHEKASTSEIFLDTMIKQTKSWSANINILLIVGDDNIVQQYTPHLKHEDNFNRKNNI